MAKPIHPSDTIFNKSLSDLILPKDILACILLSSVLWVLIAYVHNYFTNFKHLTRTKSWDSLNRLISSNYGIMSFILAVISLVNGDKCGLHNTELQNYIFTFSTGYFIYDLIFSYKYGILDNRRLIHHTVVIISELECLIMRSGAYLILKWSLFLEISNCPMQYRNILLNAGKKETKHFLLWEAIYFGAYISCRSLLFVRFLYFHYTTCVDTLIVMKISAFILLVQSFFIMQTMFKTVLIRFDELAERRSKGISLYWFEVNPEIDELEYVKTIKNRQSNKELVKLDKKE